MDRNSIIGLGLIFVLLIGYFFINQPSEKELAIQKRYADSIQQAKQFEEDALKLQANKEKTQKDSFIQVLKTDTAALKAKFGGLAAQMFGDEEESVLENNDIKITFSNKGGKIKQVQLKKYKTDSRKALLLIGEQNSDEFFEFYTGNSHIKTNEFYWSKSNESKNQISYKMFGSENASIVCTYTLDPNGYNLQKSIQLDGVNNILQPNTKFTYHFQNEIPLQERDVEKEKILTTLYYKPLEEKADFISESKDKTLVLEHDVQWVSFKQQFFNTTIVNETNFLKGSSLTTAPANTDSTVKNMSVILDLGLKAAPSQTINLKFYFGPNDYQTLKAQDINGLDKIIPLGWGIFGWINRFMIIPIFTFLQNYISNYGIVILFLTLIIKTLLLPLVFKSYKSTAKMRLLKPEMDEIKEKHKDDMQTIQMENLKLYKKAGVSPLGGCLPMLLQMPILVAVFQFVPSAFEFRQQAFLWADDLSIYDSIWNFGKLPIIDSIYGDHVSLFTLLMTISTLIYTRMNNQVTGGMNEQMKYISYLMPILFLGFFNKYAAALTYYYFLSNIITFTQQWAIKFFVDEEKLKAQIHEAKNRKGDDKKSAFQQRLEEMAKAKGLNAKKK
jgi:YidC/Oxa1 family membrane protein insertase